MLSKKTIIDTIIVDRNNNVFIKLGFQILEDDVELDCKYYDFQLSPGDDVSAKFAAVIEDLDKRNKDHVTPEDILTKAAVIDGINNVVKAWAQS